MVVVLEMTGNVRRCYGTNWGRGGFLYRFVSFTRFSYGYVLANFGISWGLYYHTFDYLGFVLDGHAVLNRELWCHTGSLVYITLERCYSIILHGSCSSCSTQLLYTATLASSPLGNVEDRIWPTRSRCMHAEYYVLPTTPQYCSASAYCRFT